MAFDPIAVFRALADHDVAYVAIGGLAATLHGSPLTTGDLDICPAADPANLERLATALTSIDARIWSDREPDGVPLPSDGVLLTQAKVWNLITAHGRVDLSFEPSGTKGYRDLIRDAVTFDVEGVPVPAASLGDVIRSKEAAGRERDRAALPTLRRLLERLEDEG
jgi:hypothetical protein